MNLKELSKEQKQYMVLGGLAAAILVILLVLGIRFSMASVSDAKEELEDLSGKISNAEHALSRSKQTSDEYIDTVSVLRGYLEKAPPARNYYSWATEVIYSKARSAGLEIDSIDEISMPQASMQDETKKISFESYSLRITAHGGYENTKYFLKQLEQNYPMVRFSGVEISSGQNPESHDIQLFLQWPFNFGDISKTWDAVAGRQNKVTALSSDSEVPTRVPSDPVPAPEPDISVEAAVQTPPAREPYPPTTRPVEDPRPATNPVIPTPSSKPRQPVEATSGIVSPAADAAPTPATDAEIEALLSDAVPPVAEPQTQITEAEPIAVMPPVIDLVPAVESETASEPNPLLEQGIEESEPVIEVLDEPQSVMESESVDESQFQPGLAEDMDTHSESTVEVETEKPVEQQVLQTMSEPEEPDSVLLPEGLENEAEEIVPAMDASASTEMVIKADPVNDFKTVPAEETPRRYVSTSKSEKILQELLSKGQAVEGTSLSSFLDGLVGEINEN